MKTIFITGASTGMGKAAALLFAERGWKVIATMRTPAKDTTLTQQKGITVLPLDVTNNQQIYTTVEKALSLGNIDVVLNNAGYGLMGPLEGATDAQIAGQLNTNLYGAIQVIKACIPHFREKHGGMFITTTSIGGLTTFPFSSVYHATKWALEGFSESLSYELKPFGITVKTVAPGGIKSAFRDSLHISQHEAYTTHFQTMMPKLQGLFHPSEPEEIAAVVYEAATDGKDQLRYTAGPDARALYTERITGGDEAFRKRISGIVFG